MLRLTMLDPSKGSYGQPMETLQHQLGPFWATFGLLIHYLASFFHFGGPSKLAPNFLHLKCAHILFWLNPTGHSKFHITINTLPPPATDRGWTADAPLHLPVHAPPPPKYPPFPVPDRKSWEAGPCAGDRHAVQQLALNVHVKLSDLTWSARVACEVAAMVWQPVCYVQLLPVCWIMHIKELLLL